MITLNIIPSKLKKELEMSQADTMVSKILIMLFLFIMTYIVIFYFSQMLLKDYFTETEKQINISGQKSAAYLNEIKDINEQISLIESMQTDSRAWTYFIEDFSRLVPESISLTRLSINKKDNTFNIAGTASTRDDLIAFKRVLENSKIFSEIDLPLGQLVEKNNIFFEFKTNINQNESN